MTVLLQPPTVYGGSLGDEALIRGALSLCEADVLLQADRQHEWVLPGVRTVTDVALADYQALVLIGADCVDGLYGRGPMDLIEDVAGRMPTRIVSFGLRPNPDPNAVVWLQRLASMGVQFAVRGAMSARRFVEHVGVEAISASDLAFLSAVDAVSRPCDGPYVVACISRRDDGFRAMVKALQAVPLDRHLVLLTHDRRDNNDLLGALMMADALGDRSHTIIEPESAAAARGYLAFADLVITHRMHVAIGAMTVGVPVVALNYAHKMDDVFGDMCLPYLLAQSPDALADRVAFALSELPACRRLVAEHLPAMKDRARLNLEGLC